MFTEAAFIYQRCDLIYKKTIQLPYGYIGNTFKKEININVR